MKYIFLLMAMILILGLVGCSGDAAGSQASEASQGQAPPEESKVEALENVQQETSLSEDIVMRDHLSRLQDWNPWQKELFEELGPDGYVVIYNRYSRTINFHLFEEWVAAFEQGEAAPPLYIYAVYTNGNELLRLDYYGGKTYTVTILSKNDETSYICSAVIQRAYDYILFIDNPLDAERGSFAVGTYLKWEMVEYDLDMIPYLGEIGPEEAVAIAHRRMSQMWAASAGWWFDLNGEELEDTDEKPYFVCGAARISEELFYTISSDFGYTYVSANGTLVTYHSFIDPFHVLIADTNERWIRPPK